MRVRLALAERAKHSNTPKFDAQFSTPNRRLGERVLLLCPTVYASPRTPGTLPWAPDSGTPAGRRSIPRDLPARSAAPRLPAAGGGPDRARTLPPHTASGETARRAATPGRPANRSRTAAGNEPGRRATR